MRNFIFPLATFLLFTATSFPQTNVILDVIGEGSSYRYNGEHPVRATDGWMGAAWRTAAVNPTVAEHWIEWELDGAKQLNRLVFWTEDDKDPGYIKPPAEIRLQTWNGGGWTDLQIWTGNTDGAFDETFGPVVAGNRIRLFFKDGGDLNTDGQFLIFPEIELYGIPHALTETGGIPENGGFLIEPDDTLSVIFNEPVSAVDLAGVTLQNLTQGTTLPGTAASIVSDTLELAHPDLVRGETYQLVVPAGSLALSSNASVLNAPVVRSFTVAPEEPRIVEAPKTVSGLQEDIIFEFDRPLDVVDPNGLRIWNITTQSELSPLSVSVNGSDLVIGHPGLAKDNLYRIILDEGTVTGLSNGMLNQEYRGALLGGEYLLYSSSFDDGQDGVTVASQLGIVTPKSTTWQWTKTNNFVVDARPEDIRHMISKSSTNNEGDFMALPPLDLVEGETYSIKLDLATSHTAGLYQNDTTDVLTAEQLLEWNPPSWGTSRAVVSNSWTSNRTGPTILMFAHADEGSDIKVDNIELVRNFPPAVQIDSPVDGLVINEGDPLYLDIEAFGITGEVTRLTVNDGAIDEGITIIDQANGRVSGEWLYDTPGARTLVITATDERGETRSVTRDLTINFSDGTLDSFLQWDFDNNDPEGVTTGGQFTAEGVKTLGTNYVSLPSVFLFAGETYTFQFDLIQRENGGVWAFQPLLVPGFPADPDPITLFDFNDGGEGRYSTQFTVPADGPYNLTLYSATGDNLRNLLDNLRLVGTFNSAPQVTLKSPTQSAIESVAGSSITIKVRAEDSDGTITGVEFRSGDVVIGTVTETDANGDYVFTWDSIPFGLNSITARAIDNNNGYADSSVIEVNAARDTLRISTYLGLTGVNEIVYDLEYQSNGTLLMAASADPSLFPGSPPVHYLNGTTPGDTGVLAVLSEDGRTVAKVLVLSSSEVVDLSLDGADRIHVALGSDGYAVLDPAASSVLHAQSGFTGIEPGSQVVHRIHAAEGGTYAILLSSTADYFDNPRNAYGKVFDSGFSHLGDLERLGTFTADLAVDEDNQQVFFVGYKNIFTDDNPVDIPTFWARSYADGGVNNLTFRGYDWGGNPGLAPQGINYNNGIASFAQDYPSWDVTGYSIGEFSTNPAPTPNDLLALAPDAGTYLDGGGSSFLDAYSQWYGVYERWLNRITNNMADTRGERVDVINGKVYATFEFDGGNTPLRYASTSLDEAATGLVQGTDPWNSTFNTSTVPKAFIGVYSTDGANLLSTWTICRLGSGLDNTIRQADGDFAVDKVGRIHTVGGSAFGLPITEDHFPGGYTGGAYYLVYSPDLETREFVGRLTTTGYNHGVAVSPNGLTALGGRINNTAENIFLRNPWDDSYAETPGDGFIDATFAVGDFRPYFQFQIGEHPRLFFSASDLPALRDKLNREPFASMRQRLEDMLLEQAELEDEPEIYHQAYAAMINGFLYQLTEDPVYAETARDNVEYVVYTSDPDFLWADPSVKGLRLNQMAVRVAAAYDWCVGAPSWDQEFLYQVSKALLEQAKVIILNGGTEQNTLDSSNWQGARGASGGLALLATDHVYGPDLLDSAHGRTVRYLDANYGNDASSQGWTPEGIGYFGFPVGDFVGPYGIAMARHDPERDLRDHVALSRAMASIYTTFSKSLNVLDYGGMKLDWADDHVHTRGNGVYNLGFYYADPDLLPGIKYWYDRTQGSVDTDRARWDELRAGPIWAYLYYPEEMTAVAPHEIYDWMETFHDDGAQGIGLFTFRNEFSDTNDTVVQFNARTRYPGGHNGPDGLGFRIIAEGNPFVVGGGRNLPGKAHGQPSLFPDHPLTGTYSTNTRVGTLLDAEVKTDGSGHVIAEMPVNNFNVYNHKRRFVADYDSASTGAAATFLIADTSDGGLYFQIPTYLRNSISMSGNTFTFTGPNGATMQGTVLQPSAGFVMTSGSMVRGNGTAFEEIFILENGDRIYQQDPVTNPGITDNGYLLIEGDGSGDFLVVLTVQPGGGPAHPAVTLLSGTVADAVVQVGGRSYAFQADDVLYDGATYSYPDALITFDPGSHGSQDPSDTTPLVQTVSRGGGASPPQIVADNGYIFSGWNKAFDEVARSMTVTAIYDAIEAIPSAPGVFVATATGGTTIDLSWDDRSVGEIGFELQRRMAAGGTWMTIASPNPETTFHSDSGLIPLTEYEYQIRALGTGGNSGWVGPATATTLVPNTPPVFQSSPLTIAYQEGIYSYTVVFSDPDADPLTATAPVLPDWLTFTPVGSGQAVLSGIPGAGDLADAPVTIRISDGINSPVEQSFTLTVNAGPAITLVEPGSSDVFLADASHGLLLEALVSDPDGVESTTWSQASVAGTAVFDDPSSLRTGVFFSEDGDYVLKLRASDGSAQNTIDVTVHVGTPLNAEPVQVVNFGGTEYVAAGKEALRDGNFQFDVLDLDGDALDDDALLYYPFSETQPLSPLGAGYDSTRTSAIFHGGIVAEQLNKTTGGFGDHKVEDRDPDPDRFLLRFQPGLGYQGRMDAVVFWKKDTFLNGADTRTLVLDADGLLSLPDDLVITYATGRWLVQSGGQYYVSQSEIDSTSPATKTLSGTLLQNELWAVYTPGTNNLDFDQDSALFTVPTADLDDVTAVGFMTDQDVRVPVDLNPAMWLRFTAFTATLSAIEEANTAPVLAGDLTAFATYDVLEQIDTAVTASDDGLPQVPGSLSYQWSTLSGPEEGVWTGDGLAAAGVVFSLPGEYVIQVAVDDGEVVSLRRKNVTIASTPYDTWIDGYPELVGTDRDPDADPNHDGIVNQLAFFHDVSPVGPSPRDTHLSGLDLADPAVPGLIVFEFRKRAGTGSHSDGGGTVSGMSYQAEWSTDLVPPWHTDSWVHLETRAQPDGSERVRIALPESVMDPDGRIFIRLSVD